MEFSGDHQSSHRPLMYEPSGVEVMGVDGCVVRLLCRKLELCPPTDLELTFTFLSTITIVFP